MSDSNLTLLFSVKRRRPSEVLMLVGRWHPGLLCAERQNGPNSRTSSFSRWQKLLFDTRSLTEQIDLSFAMKSGYLFRRTSLLTLLAILYIQLCGASRKHEGAVVIWHGMGDSYDSEGMSEVATMVSERRNVYTYNIHLGDDGASDRKAGFVSRIMNSVSDGTISC